MLWAFGGGQSSDDAAVTAKHAENVRRLGAEAAYALAVAEGEIDGDWFANEACLEFAAFEVFSRTCSSSRSAAHQWRMLSSKDRGSWVDQVAEDQDVMDDAWRQWEVRTGSSCSRIFDQVFPKTAAAPKGSPRGECEFPAPSDESEDSDQSGERIKLGLKMPPVGRDSEDDDEDYYEEVTGGGRSDDGADGETTDGDHSDGVDDHDWAAAHRSFCKKERKPFFSFVAKDDPRLASGEIVLRERVPREQVRSFLAAGSLPDVVGAGVFSARRECRSQVSESELR